MRSAEATMKLLRGALLERSSADGAGQQGEEGGEVSSPIRAAREAVEELARGPRAGGPEEEFAEPPKLQLSRGGHRLGPHLSRRALDPDLQFAGPDDFMHISQRLQFPKEEIVKVRNDRREAGEPPLKTGIGDRRWLRAEDQGVALSVDQPPVKGEGEEELVLTARNLEEASPGDAGQFGGCEGRIGEMLQDMRADHIVKGPVLEGKRLDGTHDERSIQDHRLCIPLRVIEEVAIAQDVRPRMRILAAPDLEDEGFHRDLHPRQAAAARTKVSDQGQRAHEALFRGGGVRRAPDRAGSPPQSMARKDRS